jgi:hypothetical protein
MSENIRFASLTSFTGRNGHFKCSGLNLFLGHNDLELAPLTSRGEVGNCEIVVPREALPELIEVLQSLLSEKEKESKLARQVQQDGWNMHGMGPDGHGM